MILLDHGAQWLQDDCTFVFYEQVFKKNDIGWPQQPLQEEYQISVKNWIFDDLFHKKGLVLVIWVLGPGARDDQSIKICIF